MLIAIIALVSYALNAWFATATTSYGALLGEAEGVVGDAVVPLSCALLQGATQLVLDGVWHSMSKVGTFDEASNVVWYGSDAVCDHWLQALHADA